MRTPAWIYLIIIALLTTGCAHNSEQQTIVADELERLKKQDAIISELVQKRSEKIGAPQDVRTKRQSSKRFDVSVNNVPARVFFVSLVAESGVNVVADPKIDGVISLDLKGVTLEDVLNVCRDVYGYEYKVENDIYIIFPRVLRTEVFTLNYIDIERISETQTSVQIGATDGKSSSSSDTNSNSNDSDSNTSNGNILSGTVVKTSNKTNLWENLQTTISAIIGGEEEGRTVVVNPHAGLVIVRALPKELSAVRNYIKQSEKNVKKQVILETKILEVKLNNSYQTGINWGVIQGQINFIEDVSEQLIPPDPLVESESRLRSTVLGIADIGEFLSLLETQGSVQVLSSPRVSTVNNQKAIIRVGTDEFFVTGIKNRTTSSAAATTTAPEVELGSFFSGISLDVTPQIADNGDVILHVHPIVSSVTDQQKVFTLGDQQFSIPLALRDIRESDSIVKAKSGQVVVLGGLMQESSSIVDGKRPFLGSIPGINTFFKTNDDSSVKNELVILMRPVVVTGEEMEAEYLEKLMGFESLKQADNTQ